MNDATTPSPETDVPRTDIFATTRWTLVLSAGRKSSPHSDRALEELCGIYWYPLYAYVRRRGHSHEDAEDLTQAFFARFLARNYLEGLAAERGRFRAFLLASLKHFLANDWDRSRRQKRGGGVPHLALDWTVAAARYQGELAAADSPDRLFDREWALALLARVLERLREACAAEGRAEWFERVRGYLMMGEAAIPYEEAARQEGVEPGAFRVAVHRLRRRYRALLREEIAQTLADPGQADEELRSLQAALRG